MVEMPYFMENEAWYTTTRDSRGFIKYTLTDWAPEKARQSYAEYIKLIDDGGDNIVVDN